MAHKNKLYFEMIFENEELDHRDTQVVLYLQFYTDNITVSTDSKSNSLYNFS